MDLDKQQSTDESLSEYSSMVKWLTNLSRTQRFQKTSAPKPFPANLVDQEEPIQMPPQPEPAPATEVYAVQDWTWFLNSDEGRQFMSQGNPLPSEGQEALYSLMKGNKGKGKASDKGKGKGLQGKGKGWGQDKGKGKGKTKGSPKGGFKGPCHKCGEWGHYARECPREDLNLVDEGWGSWYSPPSHQVTLMLADQPFNGYGCNVVNETPVNQSEPEVEQDWKTVGHGHVQLGSKIMNTTEPIVNNSKFFKPEYEEVDSNHCAPMVKSQVEFPSLDKKVKLKNNKSKTRMPKFTRKKRQIKRATCDGDLMTTEKVDRVMVYHGAKIDEQNYCEQSDDCACCKKPDILPDDDKDDDFMCGVCEEEDSQDPDQLELWDKFQKEY